MTALDAIHIYPIKSCRGISLPSAHAELRGFPLDRRWMLVDGEGQFLSQRNTKSLGQISIQIMDGQVSVTAPQQTQLRIPTHMAEKNRIKVRIWDDELEAITVSKEANLWFGNFLQKDVRLVYMDPSVLRPLEKDSLPQDQDFEVSFADGYPYLLTNQASLNDLNQRLGSPIGMDRFRSNLVVSGFPAFAEDSWKRIRIGAGEFQVVKPCARCQVTTIDQKTGQQSKEPLKTLASYRKVDGKVMFGMNLVALNVADIRVGDTIQIME